MSTTETLCSGCGATVTRFVDERTPEAIAYKDLSGSFFCLKVFAGDKDEMHFVELPPVAIAPEPQHTPGLLVVVDAGTIFIVSPSLGTELAEVNSGHGKEIDIANANLWAAAPDMLAALKAVKKELQLSGNWGARDYGWPENRKTIDAVISRAEGGKQ